MVKIYKYTLLGALSLLLVSNNYWQDSQPSPLLGNLDLVALQPEKILPPTDSDLGLLLNPFSLNSREFQIYEMTDALLLDLQQKNSIEKYYHEKWKKALTFLINENKDQFLPIKSWYLGSILETSDDMTIPVKIWHTFDSQREFSIGYLVWEKREENKEEWGLIGWDINILDDSLHIDDLLEDLSFNELDTPL